MTRVTMLPRCQYATAAPRPSAGACARGSPGGDCPPGQSVSPESPDGCPQAANAAPQKRPGARSSEAPAPQVSLPKRADISEGARIGALRAGPLALHAPAILVAARILYGASGHRRFDPYMLFSAQQSEEKWTN